MQLCDISINPLNPTVCEPKRETFVERVLRLRSRIRTIRSRKCKVKWCERPSWSEATRKCYEHSKGIGIGAAQHQAKEAGIDAVRPSELKENRASGTSNT